MKPRITRFAAIAAIPLIFAAAKPLADGMTYDFVMKSQNMQTNKEEITMRGRGVYAGENAKIEIMQAAATSGGQEVFGGKGTYFIVKGGGAEMFLVNPGEKTYAKWDIANLFAGMSKMVNAVGGMMKMQMSDVKIDAQDLGAGDKIQGYSTRHVKMTQAYTMTVSVLGRKSVNRVESTTDYFIAPTLRIPNPFVSNSQAMAASSQLDMFNNPDYKRQMAAAMAKLPKTGVPLRTVTTSVNTDAKGKASTTVTTMEMENFKSSNVSAREFEIPSTYTLVEMPGVNTAVTAGSNGGGENGKTGPVLNADSVAAAAKQGAADGIKEGVKAGAKDAATKKLKGIFKR